MADGTVARAFLSWPRQSWIYLLFSERRETRDRMLKTAAQKRTMDSFKDTLKTRIHQSDKEPAGGCLATTGWPIARARQRGHTHNTNKRAQTQKKNHTRQLNQPRVFNEIQQERWLVDGTFVPECNRASSVELVKHSGVNTENCSQINVDGTSLHLPICHKAIGYLRIWQVFHQLRSHSLLFRLGFFFFF